MIKIKEALRIYKNSNMFEDTVMIDLKDLEFNRSERIDTTEILYHDDILLGINVFDKQFASLFQDGFTYPDQEVLKILNDYFEEFNFSYIKEDYLRVGEVIKVDSVKNSDKLHVCEVKTSHGIHSIVCGAKNVYEGMKTIVALDNALLPTGVRIKAGPVFKVHSDGMLCSKRELGLKQNESEPGIVDLKSSESLDQSFFDLDWREYNV